MGERDEQRKAELGKARAQAQERAHHRGWQGLLDANGISSAEEGFTDMTRVLSRLEDEYGGQAVRPVAPEVVQGMRAAQQYGGISLLAQAQAAGHASPAEYLGSQVEGRLQAHEGVRRPPTFPPGVSPSPGAWGAGPGPYDYRVGMDLAGTLGRRGAEAVDAYARLAWAVRDPALGAGREAIDHLYGIAGTGWDVGAGEEQSPDYAGVVWPYFGRIAPEVLG
jgi:hypothetical protein